jgi:hypothetical protein
VSTTLEPTKRGDRVNTISGQQQTGVLWFDAARGRFVASEIRQTLNTERAANDTTIRVKTNSLLRMTVSPAGNQP